MLAKPKRKLGKGWLTTDWAVDSSTIIDVALQNIQNFRQLQVFTLHVVVFSRVMSSPSRSRMTFWVHHSNGYGHESAVGVDENFFDALRCKHMRSLSPPRLSAVGDISANQTSSLWPVTCHVIISAGNVAPSTHARAFSARKWRTPTEYS